MFGFKKTNLPIARYKNKKIFANTDLDSYINEKFLSRDVKLEPVIRIPDGKVISAVLIAGPQGSGKSYLTANVIKNYLEEVPEATIWYFSSTNLDDDPAYEDIPNMIQVITDPNNEKYIGAVLDLDFTSHNMFSFGDLFIFDDCNTIHDEVIREKVFSYMVQLLETGRKLGFTPLITSHLINPNDKKFGRILLNEMTDLVVFPVGGSIKQIRYALDNYFGFDKKQIMDVIQARSRWVWIHKCAPQYIITEHSISRP